jgi:hypothetical protein
MNLSVFVFFISVDFSLYYYTSAEVWETKMVLPVHQATKVCLSMTPDKKLQMSVIMFFIFLQVSRNSARQEMCIIYEWNILKL